MSERLPGADSAEPEKLGEFNGHEIYPMPMFATISVADVSAVAHWYVAALGFAVVFAAPSASGQPMLVHLRRRKYQDILVVPARGGQASGAFAGLTLSFATDDLDAISAQARAAAPLALSAVEGPIETPWNTRDLRVTDPAGNHLVFTTRNENAAPEQVKRMREMLEAGRKK